MTAPYKYFFAFFSRKVNNDKIVITRIAYNPLLRTIHSSVNQKINFPIFRFLLQNSLFLQNSIIYILHIAKQAANNPSCAEVTAIITCVETSAKNSAVIITAIFPTSFCMNFMIFHTTNKMHNICSMV